MFVAYFNHTHVSLQTTHSAIGCTRRASPPKQLTMLIELVAVPLRWFYMLLYCRHLCAATFAPMPYHARDHTMHVAIPCTFHTMHVANSSDAWWSSVAQALGMQCQRCKHPPESPACTGHAPHSAHLGMHVSFYVSIRSYYSPPRP